jgi:predicted DNA-binding antitoxin AbrB/MazE fold protein
LGRRWISGSLARYNKNGRPLARTATTGGCIAPERVLVSQRVLTGRFCSIAYSSPWIYTDEHGFGIRTTIMNPRSSLPSVVEKADSIVELALRGYDCSVGSIGSLARIVLTDEVQLLHQVSNGYLAMTITIDAVYENGILKLDRPLPLKEHEKVRITVEQSPSLTKQTAGMIGWTGDVETFERILKEAEETH